MCLVHIMMLLANPLLCITLVCQTPPYPPLWAVTFWHFIQRCSSAFLPRCVFAPWLHRYSFISLGMVSRHNSFCAFCPVFSQEAKKSLQWKLHLCLSPLQPLRPVLKWGQMTHEPPYWTSALALFSVYTDALELGKDNWNSSSLPGVRLRNSAVGCQKKKKSCSNQESWVTDALEHSLLLKKLERCVPKVSCRVIDSLSHVSI